MKILVCISKAPDTTSKISFIDGDTKFNTAGVQYIINPYDEWYALVRALELTENSGGTVTTITVGPAEDESIIRKALAIGATDAVRVDYDPQDAAGAAREIAAYAKDKGFDIIFTGKETIDYNGSQVGSMVAELLDLPYLPLASKLDISGNTATAQLDVKGGKLEVEVSTPFVVSASKGMAEQRIPNMRGIMAARTKPLQVVAPTSTDVMVKVQKFTMPPAKSSVKMIDPENMDELVNLLHTEAKVI